jgi:iron complex transport system substrate-binding protein
VTLAPNLTEIVYASGCGDRLVAVDLNSNYPPAAASLPQLDPLAVDAEKLVRLDPDLLLASASTDQNRLGAVARRLGVPMMVVKTDRLSEVAPAFDLLAGRIGCSDAGDARATFETTLAAEKRIRQRPPRVLFLGWHDPLYVAGHDTFADDLLDLAGARNAVPDTVKGWPQYSLESVVRDAPDLIIFPTSVMDVARARSTFAAHPIWGRLQSVREGRVYVVNEDLFTRPGPRVPQAARELNAILDGAGFR